MIEPSLLRVESVTKTFGQTVALKDVSLEFRGGEIHGVLGANGAGKSTLMAILAGFVRPDSGRVELAGQPVPLGEPFAMKRLGVRMVHQHFMLVPNFSVAENLALADLEGLAGPLELNEQTVSALKLAESLGWTLDPAARTGDLPVGVQQRIEIVKALAGVAKVLILDEPTAVLGEGEVRELFAVLRQVAAQGTAVILIAHNLDEILQVSDRISVLRHGQLTATIDRADVDREGLRAIMQGEDPALVLTREPAGLKVRVQASGVSVRGDRGEMAVREATFQVAEGEVFAIMGVDGNGQDELAEALVGLRQIASGQMSGTELAGYIPQDRQVDGLALRLSVQDNLLLGHETNPEFTAGPFLKMGKIREWAGRLIEKYAIKVHRASDPASSLSGGNQQKVVVARSMADAPPLVVASSPTRGLDIMATDFVRSQLVDRAKGSGSVVMFSADREDVALAHRAEEMSRGQLHKIEAPE